MFIIGSEDTRTQAEKLADLYHDYNGSTATYLEKVIRGAYFDPTEYRHKARTFKTRQAAEKMLEKLITFDNRKPADCGYKVMEI